jgi:hypothetical protein
MNINSRDDEYIEEVTAEVVKGYTYDDFMNTTAPFEEVYKYHNNSFEHIRAIERMSMQAKEAGFTAFKGAYKGYLKSLKEAERGIAQTLSNPTEFSGQLIQLEAGRWQCDDTGIKYFNDCEEIYACHIPILPVEVLENIDTGEEKLNISYKKHNLWRNIIVSKEILYNSRKIIQLATVGIDVTSETAKYLVMYLQDVENLNQNEIPIRKSVSRLGYIGNEGFSPFVDGLIFDGDANYTQIFDAIKEHGDITKWFATAKQCRKDSLTARIVLSASFASVLLSHIGGLPFFVHLWGVDSGTGKTVALMLAASVWGDPTMGRYIQTFNATQVGHERTAAFLNNLPFLIDELQLAKDSHGRLNFDVYTLSQGVGRTRGNKNGGIDRTPTWANCIITTGESPLTTSSSGAGAVNRVIDIECTNGNAVIKNGIEVSNCIKNNYGFAGKMFLKLLDEYSDGDLNDIYKKYFAALSETDTTEKQSMAAAMILTADKLVSEHIFKDLPPLTVEEMSQFLQTKANVSLGERGYRFICDWIVQNSNKFRSDNDGNSDVYGEISENGEWAYIIANVFRRVIENEGFSSRALLSWLKQNGKLSLSQSPNDMTKGRMTVKRTINGLRCNCYAIRLSDDDMSDADITYEDKDGVPF